MEPSAGALVRVQQLTLNVRGSRNLLMFQSAPEFARSARGRTASWGYLFVLEPPPEFARSARYWVYLFVFSPPPKFP